MGNATERPPQERRLLFRRGFGDGARCSVIKHEDEPDYMTGWEAGRIMYNAAEREFREQNGLPEPQILRAQALHTEVGGDE